MKHENFEIYKKLLSKPDYFNNWDEEQLSQLTEDLKEYIYKKYIMKFGVFTRDNFKCQNINCKTPDSKITCHHIKMVKNNGQDKSRNGITLCDDCHKNFHRGKCSITFPDAKYLPSHIRGITFKPELKTKINWKKFKSEMRQMRKNNKDICGIKLNFKQISLLMKFFELIYDDDND